MSLVWGGFDNGGMTDADLAPCKNFVPIPGTHSSTTRMSNQGKPSFVKKVAAFQAAFEAHFHKPLNVSEMFRSIYVQGLYKADEKTTGVLAATPGTSIHGWARAVDFGSGVETYGSPEKIWADANCGRFGLVAAGNTFVARGLSRNEAWHFEDDPDNNPDLDAVLAAAGLDTSPLEEDMPLTKTEKEEIATLAADEVLSRLLKSQAWDTLTNQTSNAASRAEDIQKTLTELPRAIAGFVLTNGNSFSGQLRLIGSKLGIPAAKTKKK